MAEREGVGLKVSVVVPVYNGSQTIRATVEHLLAQTYTPHEIIVVDDGSTDDTQDVLRGFGDRITLLSKPNGGPASARNDGVRVSTGSVIAFTDSDCFPEKDWLAELLKGLHAPRIAGAGGTVRGAAPGLIGEHVDMKDGLNPGFASGGKVLHLVTANACFRRDALLAANLFDERFLNPGGEDTELSIKLRSMGYELAYVRAAVVRHHHKGTIRTYLKTAANYGEGHYVLEKLWPEHVWKIDHGQGMLRSTLAVRSMLRFCLVYRKRYGWRRAAFFSFLDHYWHAAYTWGYLRGMRKDDPSTRPQKSGASKEAHPRSHESRTVSELFNVSDTKLR